MDPRSGGGGTRRVVTRPRIIVCPLSRVEAVATAERPSAVISMQSSGAPPPRPATVAPEHHLSLTFHDVVPQTVPSSALVYPARVHADAIIALARAWDRSGPLLIHCRFGISRSPAAAAIALAALDSSRNADEIARTIRSHAPSATPNALLVGHGDDALGCDGRLSRAVAAIGRGRDAMEGEVFAMELGA